MPCLIASVIAIVVIRILAIIVTTMMTVTMTKCSLIRSTYQECATIDIPRVRCRMNYL